MKEVNKIYCGDSLETLKTFPNESIDMVITSPPYWALRDYGVNGQLGLEATFQEYINKLCDIFDEVKRVLKTSGSCWVNLGDTYSGSGNGSGDKKSNNLKSKTTHDKIYKGQKADKTDLPNKCLLQIPSRFAIEMTNRGWILRNEIIWYKPNCMPSSVKDRFTVDFEKLFFFVKSKKYYFEQQKEPMKTTDITPPRGSKGVFGNMNLGLRKQDQIGRSDYTGFNDRYVPNDDFFRNKRCVWSITTKGFKEAHFAVFPEDLVITPIKACCPIGGIVLDPFMGSGTTGVVCKKLNREFVGIELNPKYVDMAEKRIKNTLVQEQLF
jgi:DNA modification methylase